MTNGKLKMRLLIIGASLFIAILIILSFIFIISSRKTLQEEKVNYLKEISLKSAESVKSQVEGMFSTIEAISTFIESYNELSIEVLDVLKKETKKNQFKRMGIIPIDGEVLTTDNSNIEGIKERNYYKKALSGKTVISDCLIDTVDKNEINVVATPIRKDNQVVSVLFATRTQESFSQSIKMESFGGKGFSYIFNSKGDAIVKMLHSDVGIIFSNIFEDMRNLGASEDFISQMEQDFAIGRSGLWEYERDNVKRHIIYTKMDISDWLLVTTVPTKAISAKSDWLIIQMIIIMSVIITVVIVVCVLMMLSLSNNNKRLSKIAYTDRVTGYSNWIKFELDAKDILINNQAINYAMVILDINKFKILNDIYGHEMGNKVLQHLANVINQEIKQDETFSRTSSDNFNILLRFKTENEIIGRLDNIGKSIKNYIEGYKIKLSAGIYPIPDNNIAINVISDRANISKIIAKKSHGVFFHFFKDENRLEILEVNEIENSMEKALENDEFQVYLQPKISVNTLKIIGAEALTRWKKDDVLLSPQSFVPIFEKNGFICKLDLYVFEHVCKTLKRWKDIGKNNIVPISVNISRVHLADSNLPHVLFSIAQKYQIEPKFLEIELTESAVYSDVESMIVAMQQIKEFGFKMSIDDFGSGYSSLSALKDLPADFVKLDKSFIDQSEYDNRGEKIIESIVLLVKGLGLATIAEGIETDKQMALLKKVGCEYAQGFWFSKPVPILEFEKKIQIQQP